MFGLKHTLSYSLVLLALNFIQAQPINQHGEFTKVDDMLLSTVQLEHLRGNDLLGSALSNPKYYWPNATLVYHITNEFSSAEIEKIKKAMSDISKRTCVTFRETFHPTEPQVTIQRKYDSCVAHVGYQNGTQILNLAVDCMASGRIKHELLHALGFVHMHCDPRRDNYVKILEENIIEGQEYNFEKYPATEITDLGLEYDYGSIMHYSTTEFTKNGLPTMIPLQPGVRIGQLDGLSPKDFQKIARVYCQKKNNNNNAI